MITAQEARRNIYKYESELRERYAEELSRAKSKIYDEIKSSSEQGFYTMDIYYPFSPNSNNLNKLILEELLHNGFDIKKNRMDNTVTISWK